MPKCARSAWSSRDMTFYSTGSTEPNPTLRLRAGERVRIVLRNDDAGISTTSPSPVLGVATDAPDAGRADSRSSSGARSARRRTLHLPPHAQMMRVRSRSNDPARGGTAARTARHADAKGRYVRRLFATIADRYDLITGPAVVRARSPLEARARRARRRPARHAGARPRLRHRRHRVRARARAARASPASTSPIGCCSSRPRKRPVRGGQPACVAGDMMALPVPDGLRCRDDRLRHPQRAGRSSRRIAEIRRVLRPGGLLLSLDFDRPGEPARPRRLSRLPDRRRLARSAGCCTAIPTPTATFRSRFAAIPEPRPSRRCCARRASRAAVPAAARRPDGHPSRRRDADGGPLSHLQTRQRPNGRRGFGRQLPNCQTSRLGPIFRSSACRGIASFAEADHRALAEDHRSAVR